MEFTKEHAGKWVAIKGQKVVESGKTLKRVMGKVEKRKDKATIGYSLVPRGCFAGILHYGA